MKTMRKGALGIARTAATLVIVAGLMGVLTDANAELALRLAAADYDSNTGTWTDTSGLNNHATQGDPGRQPTLVEGQTENGSPVVRFDGPDFLDLTSTILPTSDADGFTVFAFLRPLAPDAWRSIVSGLGGGFSYNITPTNLQRVDRSFQMGLDFSNTVLSSDTFSSINVQNSDAGGGYRLNGVDDGTLSGSSHSAGINRVGETLWADFEPFKGDIAEIRIYDTQLTLQEIQVVEAELHSTYVSGAIFAITEIQYAPDADPPTVTLTWTSLPGATYGAFSSLDLSDWSNELADSLGAADDEIPDDGNHITVTFKLDNGLEDEPDLFLRIQEE
jgi:hypothetical protein